MSVAIVRDELVRHGHLAYRTVVDLRHLEQIAAIARAGSFSSAARQLGLSQPALSKSIARLEAELNVQLFDRSSGAARPTRQGRYVAERAEKLLESVASLATEVEQWSTGEAGTLRIGIGPVTRIKPLPEVLGHLVRQFPKLRIHVRLELGANLPGAVARGQVDVAFSYHRNADHHGDLIRIKLFEDAIVAIARPGHPALTQGSLSARDMLRFPIASFGDLPAFRQQLDELTPAEEANLTAFVSDNSADLAQLTEQTDAIARVPRFALADRLADGRLVEVPISWQAKYECWMLTTASRGRSPVIKAIAEFARRFAESASAGAEPPGDTC